MSYMLATPTMLSAAPTDVLGIGSSLSAVKAAAAGPTTRVVTAEVDDVSAGIAALVSERGQDYRALSAEEASFGAQLIQT